MYICSVTCKNTNYNTIVVKDIMSRNKLSDVMMLESVIRFTADYDNIKRINVLKWLMGEV